MFKKAAYVTAFVAAGVLGGFVAGQHVMAAAAGDFPYEQQIGGGAPFKVLLDNDVIKVTRISFPKGSTRQGGVKRKMTQLLVYFQPAEYTHLPTPGGPTFADPHSKVAVGAVTFHPKDTVVGTLVTDKAYDVLYLEFKKD